MLRFGFICAKFSPESKGFYKQFVIVRLNHYETLGVFLNEVGVFEFAYVAPQVEPAVAGETPSLLWHGLEPLFEDYALALLVWSQQTATAELIRAITNGVIKKPHELGSCGYFMCLELKMTTHKFLQFTISISQFSV